MGTFYRTNWVVCLADDLMSGAKLLQLKASLTKQGKTLATKYPSIPASLPLYADSRITIFGHGNPSSTIISGNAIEWTPQQCAEAVKRWCVKSNVKSVKRISFHMCYGAKAKDEKGSFHSSFVHKFASYCDFADEVIGRTDVTRITYIKSCWTNKPEEKWISKVSRETGDKEKQMFRKIKFLPTGGTLSRPKAPVSFLCWDGELSI